MIVFFNNEFVDETKLSLKVSDLSVQRGYAVFDFFRTKNFKPLFLEDYLDRFYHSALQLRLDPKYKKAALTNIISELIAKNNVPEIGVKLLCTGGYSADGYQPADPNLIITLHPLVLTSPEKFSEGIKIITWNYQRDLPGIKSTSYLMGVWLQQTIRDRQAADALYHNNGIVTECPRSNVFIVTHDQKLVTPSENILPGITRKRVLELANGRYQVETRDIFIDELKEAAEVFTTSTTKRILPIKQVDDTIIGDGRPGPVSTALHLSFLEMEDRYCKE